MIHMYTGKDVMRDTKTACKLRLDELPRSDGSVPYKQKKMIDCEKCLAVVRKIETMRGQA